MAVPPFIGARNQTPAQKAELVAALGGGRHAGNVDYVAGWYRKAAEYMRGTHARAAFVSTNSICQGEQVAPVWEAMAADGVRINFAHDTFRWASEAADTAHVFCVVVGFSREPGPCTLYHHAGPDAEAAVSYPAHLNAYLKPAPDVFIYNRSKPLCAAPEMGIGNKPIDGGNYLFTDEEKKAFLRAEPAAEPHFHPWLGSQEFLHGKPRWCLWLGELTPTELNALPHCKERVRAVREFRLASKSAPTRKLAERPACFHVENMPQGTSILVPKVSSERRRYAPMGFIGPETFCSDLVFLIADATLYHFGVLQSRVHAAWMRTVAGRLESRYRYSAGVVYNNFPWPGATRETLATPVSELVPDAVKSEIEATAQAVLDARAAYPGSTLAELYDPDDTWMYPKLQEAHTALDEAVEAAYGQAFHGDEDAMVAHLFARYAALTATA